MKKRIQSAFLLFLVFVLLVGTVPASASDPYATYTYSIDGEPLASPTAYSAETPINSEAMGLSVNLKGASDVVCDEEGNVYIADSDNSRVVVLDKYYRQKGVITSYVENGETKNLVSPCGIFVCDPNKMIDGSDYIFVCNSSGTDSSIAKNVVVYDRNYNTVQVINKPNSSLLTTTAWSPSSIAVDIYGRIFIVSGTCYEGVIVLSGDGEFTGFIGAQKVTYNLLQMIWRRFQSDEQRASEVKNISYPYNNIAVDDDGFIYVTNYIESYSQKQFAALTTKSADYSPVKKLNAYGTEIMKRNGFFDPGGEVAITKASEVSTIKDVAIGLEGSWSILDTSRSRVFTYDQNGNLLFAFGETGDQRGNGEQFVSMTYQPYTDSDGVLTYKLLLLDNAQDGAGYKLNVYTPTDYCKTILKALQNQNEHNYDTSIYYWQDVLKLNNNFDLAYIGIGKALFNLHQYEEAEEMFKFAYETDYYSKSFAKVRKDILSSYWLIPIIIGVIALIVLFIKFLGYAKRKNKATSLKVGKKTYAEELLYVFHLVFHPFDGFWDLKHEKRGSPRSALTILGITVLAFFYQAIGRGYSFNPRGDYSSIFIQIIAVIVPIFLWIIANWCLTTLFDGEGSFKDILVATCYSLAPVAFCLIVSTILSNVLTVTEGAIVTLLVTIGYIWSALLLFFGMSVTHDYSMGKNFVTVIGTIVAMAVIMFVSILFSSLVIKMVTFIIAIVTEIGNRV